MASPLILHNTLSGKKEPFEALEPGKVRLYVCGPTVYDDAHLGHARCYITWDVLYRFLLYQGYTVRYVRNITDVDDKILNRAHESGEPFKNLAEHYTKRFHEDMANLHVLSPTHEPRATDYIDEMIHGISILLEKEAAYIASDGSVYFRATAKHDYGKLWKQPLDDLKTGARIESDPNKQHPLDFALWKAVPPEDPNAWDAPWGRGRPGWHMECSAMNHALFGEQIDIHTGGADLIFPHHENEIAQSETWTGKIPFANYWLHNGFVNVGGEKMSKSLGNFSTVKTVLETYDANTLRYFLLSHHYRMPVDFNDQALTGAKNRMVKIHRSFHHACDHLGIHPEVLREYPIPGRTDLESYPLLKLFEQAMADDLNTPKALAVMDEGISTLNNHIRLSVNNLSLLRSVFVEAFAVFTHLGFNPQLIYAGSIFPETTRDALQTIYRELTGKWLESDGNPTVLLDEILRLRQEAKTMKNWAQADAIRKHLSDIGIELRDQHESTAWELLTP